MTKAKAAPGMKRRKRAGGTYRYLWLPRDADIRRGFLPRSRELPEGEDAPAVQRRAVLCRRYQGELLAWRAGEEPARPRHPKGTFGAIIARYEEDDISPFQELQPSTQESYSGYLRTIERAIGRRQIGATSGEDLLRWHRDFRKGGMKRGTGGWVWAKHCMGAIRRLAKYAVVIGHPEAAHIETLFQSIQFRGGEARTAAPTWAQVQAFVASADAMGRWSIGTAIQIMFDLTRRRSEVIGRYERLGPGEAATGITWNGKRWRPGILWSDIDAEWVLRFKENKTRKKEPQRLFLSAYPHLRARLGAVPRDRRIGPLIVSEASGRPYSAEQFRKEFNRIAMAAGWPGDIWSMDCRSGGATELADAAVAVKDEVIAERMIESHTGHTTKRMAKRYARQTEEAFVTAARLRQEHRTKA